MTQAHRWEQHMGQLAVVNFVSLDGVMQSVLSADEDRDGGFDQGGWVLPYTGPTVESTATTRSRSPSLSA
ncbi:hypothetical protein [Streptomyces sp. NPDC058595]|uniref:hypothetical protein n=1 Tax=Streptomyces sp. NPDC058595 TaxID=3346550 RepID=UPI00364B64F1